MTSAVRRLSKFHLNYFDKWNCLRICGFLILGSTFGAVGLNHLMKPNLPSDQNLKHSDRLSKGLFRDSIGYGYVHGTIVVLKEIRKGKYSKASKYAAPITADFADTRFLIGSKNIRKTLKIRVLRGPTYRQKSTSIIRLPEFLQSLILIS